VDFIPQVLKCMRSILQIDGEINEDIMKMIHADWLKWKNVLTILWVFANTPPHIQHYWAWCDLFNGFRMGSNAILE